MSLCIVVHFNVPRSHKMSKDEKPNLSSDLKMSNSDKLCAAHYFMLFIGTRSNFNVPIKYNSN